MPGISTQPGSFVVVFQLIMFLSSSIQTTFKMSGQGAIFPNGVLCMFFKFCFSRLGNAGRPLLPLYFFHKGIPLGG